MSEPSDKTGAAPAGRGGGGATSWRDATRFNQGEAYDGAAKSPRRSLVPVVVGGVGMLAATLLLRLVGAPVWLAVGIGLALFAVVLIATRPGPKRRSGPPSADADALKAAALDPRIFAADMAAAEAELAVIDAAAAGLANRSHQSALAELTEVARDVLHEIAADPGDIRRARRYLKVYLPSMRASVEKFAALGVINDQAIDDKFGALVEEMVAVGRRQREALSADDRMDLETEIEVLAERLTQER